MRTHSIAFVIVSSLSLVGCDEASPPVAEPEPLAVASRPLPLEGTPTAYAMLRVVNELDFTALDEQVGLDRRAAQSIVAFRAGDDEVLGSADDRYVATLAELDAQYWLGDANLWALQSHALREGYAVASLPEPACVPALAELIEGCLRYLGHRATAEADRGQMLPACLEQAEPGLPSGELFAAAGLPPYEDPWLGYHALLCSVRHEPELCELGVAGLAAELGPACDERYDGR